MRTARIGERMDKMLVRRTVEERLARSRIPFRKTKRAERIPGYDQAPDFFAPDEFNPSVIVTTQAKDKRD